MRGVTFGSHRVEGACRPLTQIRSELRKKMVEFATVMREYSEEIAAKNRAYVEAARNTTDMISSHIEAVRAAMKAVAHEGAPTAAIPDMRQALQ